MNNVLKTPKLDILLANPRGFCAGVERAIRIVENALIKFGAPIYVRHEIVHNRYVVEGLKAKGAVFVDELDQVPAGGHVIFSAHGVAKSVFEDAEKRKLEYIDATCPLVSKVHRGAERFYNEGCHLLLIGHAGHPEVMGTMGQLPEGCVTLIETEADVDSLKIDTEVSLAYVTQTTLSVGDTQGIVRRLKSRFPKIKEPAKSDICYATSNRQLAVKALAEEVELIFVIGAENSSNSKRLVEVGQLAGCSRVVLIRSAEDIDWTWLDGVSTLGITAGASAPEILVQEVIKACEFRFSTQIGLRTVAQENIIFRLPRSVSDVEPEQTLATSE